MQHGQILHANKASYSIQKELLNLKMQVHQSKDIIEFFKTQIKNLSRRDESFPDDFVKIHHMSRMCWELTMHFQLTNLDRQDIDLLYEMPHNEKNEWLFTILNGVRFQHSIRTTECSILMADQIAKDFEHIMKS